MSLPYGGTLYNRIVKQRNKLESTITEVRQIRNTEADIAAHAADIEAENAALRKKVEELSKRPSLFDRSVFNDFNVLETENAALRKKVEEHSERIRKANENIAELQHTRNSQAYMLNEEKAKRVDAQKKISSLEADIKDCEFVNDELLSSNREVVKENLSQAYMLNEEKAKRVDAQKKISSLEADIKDCEFVNDELLSNNRKVVKENLSLKTSINNLQEKVGMLYSLLGAADRKLNDALYGAITKNTEICASYFKDMKILFERDFTARIANTEKIGSRPKKMYVSKFDYEFAKLLTEQQYEVNNLTGSGNVYFPGSTKIYFRDVELVKLGD
jgi:chromosome segregation ATPase